MQSQMASRQGLTINAVVLLLCLIIAGCSGSDTPPSVSQRDVPCTYDLAHEAAGVELSRWITAVDGSQFGLSPAEFSRATIGKGYRRQFLSFNSLLTSWTVPSVQSALDQKICSWEFPVLVDDRTRVDLIVSYLNPTYNRAGRWVSDLGGLSSVKIAQIEDKVPDLLSSIGMSRYQLSLIVSPELATEMALITTDAGEYVSLLSPPSEYGLSEQTFFRADDVIPVFRTEAARVYPDVNGPVTDDHHSSGRCSYDQARQKAELFLPQLQFELMTSSLHMITYYFGNLSVFLPQINQTYVGDGFRDFTLDPLAYEPGKSVRSALSTSCSWQFGLSLNGEPKMDMDVQYYRNDLRADGGYGGNFAKWAWESRQKLPDLIRDQGIVRYHTYFVIDYSLSVTFLLVDSDRGEFISLGVPPLHPSKLGYIPDPTNQKTFYRPEEIMPSIKEAYRNTVAVSTTQ